MKVKLTIWLILFFCTGLLSTGNSQSLATCSNLSNTSGLIQNILYSGAVPNDGIDDAPALQAAVDMVAAAGGGVVCVPEGVWTIAKTIRVASYVELRGEGETSVLQVRPGSLDRDINPVLSLRDVDQAAVTHLKIDGNARNLNQLSGHAAIYMSGVRGCLIENITVDDTGKTTEDPAGSQILLNALEPEETVVRRSDIANVESRNNIIRDCTLDDPLGKASFGIRLYTAWKHDKDYSAYTVPVHQNLIENNTLIGFSWNAIEIAGPATFGNLITKNEVSSHRGRAAIEVDKGGRNNIFTYNLVRDFLMARSGGTVGAYRIQGGFSNTNPRRVHYASGNSFLFNRVSDLGASAIHSGGFFVSWATNNLISDNVLDVNQNAGKSFGIRIHDDVHNLMIDGNIISGAHYGIENHNGAITTASSGVTIRDNQIDATYNGINFTNTTSYAYDDLSITGNTLIGDQSNVAISINGVIEDSLINNNLIGVQGDGIRINAKNATVQTNTISVGGSMFGIRLFPAACGASVIGNTVINASSKAFRNDVTTCPVKIENNNF